MPLISVSSRERRIRPLVAPNKDRDLSYFATPRWAGTSICRSTCNSPKTSDAMLSPSASEPAIGLVSSSASSRFNCPRKAGGQRPFFDKLLSTNRAHDAERYANSRRISRTFAATSPEGTSRRAAKSIAAASPCSAARISVERVVISVGAIRPPRTRPKISFKPGIASPRAGSSRVNGYHP